MTELREKLLGCPFCGGEAEMSHYAKGTSATVAGYYVECSSCSAGGEPFDINGEMPDREEYTKSKALDAWNTRAPVAAPTSDALGEAVLRQLGENAAKAAQDYATEIARLRDTLQKAEQHITTMLTAIAGGNAEAGRNFADRDPVVAEIRAALTGKAAR